MSSFPPLRPPGSKALVTQEPAVGTDEVSLILRRTLKAAHLTDPNVMGFIAKYILCRDVKQAGREVGLDYRAAQSIRRKPDVNEAINQITEASVFRTGYDASTVVTRVREFMEVDPADIIDPVTGACIENMHHIAPEVRRSIKKFEVVNQYGKDPNGMPMLTGKLIKVEMWDKLKSAELLGRDVGRFTETKVMKHDVSDNMADILLGSKKRGDDAVANMREVNQSSPGQALSQEDTEDE